MAFSDDLDALLSQPQVLRACKVRTILSGDSLSEEEREKLDQVIHTPRDGAGFVNNLRLTKFLRSQGFEIAVSSIDRHRRGDCACAETRKAGN